MRCKVGGSKAIRHAFGRRQDTFRTLRAEIDGVRNDGKAHSPEAGNGARHMAGRRHQQPALVCPWFGQGQALFGVLECVTGNFLRLDALCVNAEINRKPARYSRFR